MSLLTGARSFSLGNSGISLKAFGLFCYCHFVINQDSGLPKQFRTFLLSLSSRPPLPLHRCQIAAAENPSFFSCSTWSRIIDISGETTIIVEFSKVRAALAKRGNSWKIKLLPKPVGIIPKTSLPRATSQTLVESTRQRGFMKITRAIRVSHLGDDKLMTTLLGDDVNCHNWPIRGYIRSWYTGTGH